MREKFVSEVRCHTPRYITTVVPSRRFCCLPGSLLGQKGSYYSQQCPVALALAGRQGSAVWGLLLSHGAYEVCGALRAVHHGPQLVSFLWNICLHPQDPQLLSSVMQNESASSSSCILTFHPGKGEPGVIDFRKFSDHF